VKEDWTPLHGGKVNSVSQRGEVVRRKLTPASPAVHQLLDHLETCNVPLVPRLQTGDAQHEYLSYLPGEAVFRPWPDAVRGDAWLTDLGRWLRVYHDVVQGFRVRDAGFSWGPTEPDAEMIVCHGDIGPWNLLHRNGRLTGVIDWDLARYGDPLDDVAELALEVVPLHARLSETLGVVARETLEVRLNALCRAYGAASDTVLQHAPAYLQMVVGDIRKLSAEGAEPFVAFAEGGIPEGLEEDLDYCLQTWL